MLNSSIHDGNDSKNCVAIDHQQLICNLNFNIISKNQLSFQMCGRLWNSFTWLWLLFQQHQRNVIHDYAYHHPSYYDFPLDIYLVVVLTGHCMPILDPNPRRRKNQKWTKIWNNSSFHKRVTLNLMLRMEYRNFLFLIFLNSLSKRFSSDFSKTKTLSYFWFINRILCHISHNASFLLSARCH